MALSCPLLPRSPAPLGIRSASPPVWVVSYSLMLSFYPLALGFVSSVWWLQALAVWCWPGSSQHWLTFHGSELLMRAWVILS